eukprot:COSAG02_NODE_3910_length_6056_cov_3.352694_9_plen_75_part_00
MIEGNSGKLLVRCHAGACGTAQLGLEIIAQILRFWSFYCVNEKRRWHRPACLRLGWIRVRWSMENSLRNTVNTR